MKTMTFALLFGNRGFFPGSVIATAREEMCRAVERAGARALCMDASLTRYGAVETREEGKAFADFLKAHEGEYDGLIICMPNFSDENGIKEAIKDVRVPILMQAYPDELDKLDFANRRDAFCGRLGLCAVLKQMGVTFVSGNSFVAHPLSDEFHKDLLSFVSTCRIVKKLRHARVGVIGARTTAFKSVRFDEGALEARGVDVETLDLSQVFDRIKAIGDDDARLAKWMQDLSEISNTCEAPEYAMLNQCKLGVALEELVAEMELDALTIRCWSELQYEYKIAPCSVMGVLNKRQIPVVCETDVTNAPAMLALAMASYTGVGCLDVNNNYGSDPDKCILFHCGPLPIDLMVEKGRMTEHKMFTKTQGCNCSWGVNEGRMKPASVTLCGMRTENGETRYFVEAVEVLDIELDRAFFGTYGVVGIPDLQKKLIHMGEEGFRHHVLVTEGDHTKAVREALSKYLGYTEIKL